MAGKSTIIIRYTIIRFYGLIERERERERELEREKKREKEREMTEVNLNCQPMPVSGNTKWLKCLVDHGDYTIFKYKINAFMSPWTNKYVWRNNYCNLLRLVLYKQQQTTTVYILYSCAIYKL